MLEVERAVVDALLDTDDPAHRDRVQGWVEGSLDDMPGLLRLGVVAESMLVEAWRRARPSQPLSAILATMERSPIGLLQQYPRLFRSLVLFGDLELDTAPSTADR